MRLDFSWDWPGGVALYGVCRAYEATGEESYLAAVKDWVDEYLEIGIPPFNVNVCAMGHCLLSLHDATGEDRYLELATRKAEYLETQALRFGEGVLQHTVSSKNDFPGQAWADTLFMAAYFLLRAGLKTGNKAWVDDALRQYGWHEELLQDPVTNLYYHGYDDQRKDHLSGIYWGRANAWAAYTMARALTLINYIYPEFMAIEGALRDQLSALVRLQSPEGLWHTVLDDEESYCETSASAGIAAAIALRGYPLHDKYLAKASSGIVANIGSEGSVLNVSGGTAIMPDREAYRRIPRKRAQGWGQGLTLAFLSALLSRSSSDMAKEAKQR
jgi:Predicted unsaturated glucuronyl hydrolase involved in regulation of bacterial surface properties, and related proteins